MKAYNLYQTESKNLQEKGYVVRRRALAAGRTEALLRIANDLACRAEEILRLAAQQKVPPFEIPSVFRDLVVVPEASLPGQVCRVEDVLTANSDLAALVAEEITPLVSDLMGDDYCVFKDKLNFKWPGGGAFPAHQDFPAYSSFKPRSHVTVMLTIDPATQENGCLQFADNFRDICRSAAPNREVRLLPLDGEDIRADLVDRMHWNPVATSPADLVLFDSFVPHCSETNESHAPRRALFITYNRAAEGDWRDLYYRTKRDDPGNPMFHHATPTLAGGQSSPPDNAPKSDGHASGGGHLCAE